jgi:cytochrome c oxidase subunit 1
VSATTTPSALTPPMRTTGFLGAVISTDHKRIGLNLGLMSLIFFVVGGIFALIMRSQLYEPNNNLVSDNTYNMLFTMHGSTMIYLFVTPMALGLATYLVPLQIGAASISLPRFTLAGFWVWLSGGLIMQSGWFSSDGAGRAGWSSYAPLSNGQRTPGVGMDLWVIGAGLAVLGMFMIGWALAVTILRRRAPGMALLRMPVFTWTALVSVFMVVGAFPVLVFAMALLFANRMGAPIFQGFTGSIDWQDLFWFFGHPVVYVMFFPYLGCAAEAIAANAHKRWFGYKAFVASMMAFAALSMSVWGHHMLITGGVVNEYFAFSSTMLVIPAGIEYFDCVGTLWGSAVRFRTSMLFALGFFIQFLIGGLSGIFVASPVLDYNSYGDYIVVAHFHYTLFAGSIFGFFAGVYHWYPKVTGAHLREGLGKIHFLLLVIGTNLTFGPMFILGEDGMTRRIARYPTNPQWATLNQIETIGAGIIALAVLVFLINLAVSMRRRVPAGDDPWQGHTLEWWTSSPPPPHNFDRPLPPIHSYAPLKDLREELERAEREKQEAPA